MLKNSVRNCRYTLSLIGKFLKIEKSTLLNGGPGTCNKPPSAAVPVNGMQPTGESVSGAPVCPIWQG